MMKYPYLTALIFLFLLLFGPFFVYYYDQQGEILSVYSHLNKLPKAQTRSLPSKDSQEYIRILSIDGGGIYGILPAHVVQYLEEKSGKRTTELFDLMMGTSTGALLNVILNIPDASGQPKYTASEALEIYNRQAKKIFYSPWYHRVLTLNGLIGSKYMTSARYSLFRDYLGSLYFDQLLNNVVIPAYDMEGGEPLLFYNWKEPDSTEDNYGVIDLLMGAISFPGLFPSVVLGSKEHPLILVDGAIFVNNPSLTALLVAMKLYPNKKYILVSLGTGRSYTQNELVASKIVEWGDLQWSTSLVQAILSGNKKFNDLIINKAFPFPVESYRFNVDVSAEDGGVDDVHPANLQKLNEKGAKLVESNLATLDALVEKLTRSK